MDWHVASRCNDTENRARSCNNCRVSTNALEKFFCFVQVYMRTVYLSLLFMLYLYSNLEFVRYRNIQRVSLYINFRNVDQGDFFFFISFFLFPFHLQTHTHSFNSTNTNPFTVITQRDSNNKTEA